MFVGHFAVALAAKKATPGVSLGTLVFAAQFLDLLWPIFLLTGIEHVRIDPGNTAVTPLDFYDYPVSHSLLTAIGWAVIVGGTSYLVRRDARISLVLYGVVFSHWILDLITHRPDLPIVPGMDLMVGFGLWNSVAGTILVELVMLLGATAVFIRTSAAVSAGARLGFWLFLCFLIFVWLGSIFGPPPPDETILAVTALTLWLLVPICVWIDRGRALRSDLPS